MSFPIAHSDIFDQSAEKNKFSYTEDIGPPTGAIWNPYNIDLNSLTRDTTGSGSSTTYSFENAYNPKYNNNPDDSLFDNYRFGVSDWESEYSPRQRGTIGSDMYTSGSSHRPKKTSSPPQSSNSKRAVTKLIAKPNKRTPKRISQPNKEPDRDLMPPPPKK